MRILTVLSVLLALVALPGTASAADVAGLAAELVPRLLSEHGVPGASVAVVTAGQVKAQGYGYADRDRRIPVDAAGTRFATASLAKTFTAAAVLQLVRAGRLDLDRDVNTYLTTFQIPDTFPGHPVTLRHLLTHTAGFESNVLATSWTDPAAAEPLAKVVEDGLPERVRPPGTVLSYDNYAYDLAGYVIEATSGQAYAQYVKQHILDPLGMTGTTFATPDPATLATGYGDTGSFAHYYGHPSSGTGPVTTAADMGKLMQALLTDDPRLGPGVAAAMKTRQFTQDPRLPGIGYGLEETARNGHRLLFKAGDVNGFHALMTLLPDQRTGIYVVLNGEHTPYDVVHQIIDRAFPGTAERPPPTGGDTTAYAGTYVTTQSRGDLLRFATLFDHVTVTATGSGELTTTGLSADGTAQRWRQVGPGLFAERDGPELIAFTGHGVLAGGHREEATTFERSPVTLHVWLLYAGLAAFLAALIGMPVAALVRRLRRRPARHRFAWWLAWLTGALVAVFVYGLATTVIIAPTDAILVGSPLLTGALLASSTAFVLTGGLVACTGVAWWKRWWGLPGRISYTAYTIAALAFMTVAYLYNLVGGVFA
ncbi:serine hydrolase [Nonomuraea phyllanthi]|uniref:Serine hydrolase n=1 Tax=Nonomuraea phyllanthi TaxID=2219224 RepID=A0A5C4WX72_9ACTN|nr:serine hydrolase domain-containing protein [Nonomuraea phyllanthi]KAB8197455.1 serine hydrolase [Nonomuraea phyllanthi]